MALDRTRDCSAADAFRELVDAHRTRLIRFGLRRLDERDTVEELISEVFLTAWIHFDERPDGEDALYWLYAIAHRTCANMLRGQCRRRRLHRRLEQEPGLGDLDTGEDSGAIDRLLAQVDVLPQEDRETLELAYWERLSHREIGIVLGCSENAVTLRLSRARKRLRDRLGVYELDTHTR